MADKENTNWDYKPTTESGSENKFDNKEASDKQENVSWTALEFIEHDRGSGWYVMLIAGAIILAVVIYFITKDYFAAAATVIVGFIEYEITDNHIRVGERTYGYGMFKSFSVAHEGEHTSIVLEPVKKFVPPMTLYFPPEDEPHVTNAIGNHLPMQEHQPNITERLAHRFRF
jgi:hypothetical protein